MSIDKTEQTAFLQKIGFPSPAMSAVLDDEPHHQMKDDEYRCLKDLYYKDRERFYKKICETEDGPWRTLLLYIRFAMDLSKEYEKKGIDREIYYDTFRDLTLWTENCYRECGQYGIREYGWFFRHLECKLFRLGRLQYEIMESPWEIAAGSCVVHPGETVINVHIPQGEKLLHDAVLDSIGRAKRFWGKEYVYVCHSWLLFPGLRDVLSETANILRFQSLFDIAAIDFDTREAESRIYGLVRDNVAEYPESTSLQRKAKACLLDGKRLGNGLGILKMK